MVSEPMEKNREERQNGTKNPYFLRDQSSWEYTLKLPNYASIYLSVHQDILDLFKHFPSPTKCPDPHNSIHWYVISWEVDLIRIERSSYKPHFVSILRSFSDSSLLWIHTSFWILEGTPNLLYLPILEIELGIRVFPIEGPPGCGLFDLLCLARPILSDRPLWNPTPY